MPAMWVETARFYINAVNSAAKPPVLPLENNFKGSQKDKV
jgi:hypothetical protein